MPVLLPILEALTSAIAVVETVGGIVIAAITLYVITARIVGIVRWMGKK